MKIVYIAHPISGDIKGNLEKIRLIVRKINLERDDVVPFAPYWLDCHALNDDVPEERARGIKNDIELFRVVDEVWLFGDRISSGMSAEINLAIKKRIGVVPQTPETSKDFREYLAQIQYASQIKVVGLQ